MSDVLLGQSGQGNIGGFAEEGDFELPTAPPDGEETQYDHLFRRPQEAASHAIHAPSGPVADVTEQTADLLEGALADESSRFELHLAREIRNNCIQKLSRIKGLLRVRISSLRHLQYKNADALEYIYTQLDAFREPGKPVFGISSRRRSSEVKRALIKEAVINMGILTQLLELKVKIENKMLELHGHDDQLPILGEVLVEMKECIDMLYAGGSTEIGTN